MKRSLLFTVILVFAVLQGWAQFFNVHITGTVTDLNNNTPIINHAVTIQADTLNGGTFLYYQVVYTDSTGVYNDYINVPQNQQVLFHIGVVDCNGTYHSTTGLSTNSPIVADFAICNTSGPCAANFTFSINQTTSLVEFVDQSTGNPTVWLWSFGDGTSSTLQNPHHTYPGPGTYTVILTISGNGCTSTYNTTITITGPGNCNASWVMYPDSNSVNTYHFISTSTGNINQYLWTFGDGATANTQDPHHTYTQTGVYLVCLTIFGPNCQDSYCDSINVGGVINPCHNYITYTVQGSVVHFIGNTAGGTGPFTYVWDFGDGTSGNTHDPAHTYAQGGTYTVTLTTTDANGCTFTSTTTVTIILQTTVDIWGHVTAGNIPLDEGIAYLYYGGNGTLLTLIDSTSLDSIGIYRFHMVPNVPGHYFTKVAPSVNSAYYLTHLPTYYGHSLFWANATPIITAQISNPYNIELIHLIAPGQGNGNITGQITSGGKTFFANGVPAPNVEILLLNTNNQAVSIDYSDNLGYFSYSNLAMGTYKLYAEVTGLTTDPAVVTLTSSNPSVTNASILITPSGVISGINEPGKDILSINKLYPNPTADITYLEIGLLHPATIEVSLINLMSEKIMVNTLELSAGNHSLPIVVEGLAPGTYMLQIQTPDGIKHINKILVIK